MKFHPLEIEGAWQVESKIWPDERGIFREWFKAEQSSIFLERDFKVEQANMSCSNFGVIRGIHYSLAKNGQSKWVTCVSGSVLDLIVDIRPKSPTFKKYKLIQLNAEEGISLFIDAGLGHGFLSLADNSIVTYLLDSQYSSKDEFTINAFDPEIHINWNLQSYGVNKVIQSNKDLNAPSLITRFNNQELPNL